MRPWRSLSRARGACGVAPSTAGPEQHTLNYLAKQLRTLSGIPESCLGPPTPPKQKQRSLYASHFLRDVMFSQCGMLFWFLKFQMQSTALGPGANKHYCEGPYIVRKLARTVPTIALCPLVEGRYLLSILCSLTTALQNGTHHPSS